MYSICSVTAYDQDTQHTLFRTGPQLHHHSSPTITRLPARLDANCNGKPLSPSTNSRHSPTLPNYHPTRQEQPLHTSTVTRWRTSPVYRATLSWLSVHKRKPAQTSPLQLRCSSLSPQPLPEYVTAISKLKFPIHAFLPLHLPFPSGPLWYEILLYPSTNYPLSNTSKTFVRVASCVASLDTDKPRNKVRIQDGRASTNFKSRQQHRRQKKVVR